MQILIFSTVFYPLRGGIENLTLNLCQEFIENGHEVKVITYQKQIEPLNGIDVYYAPGFKKMLELFSWCKVYYMPNISLKGVWPLLIDPGKRWVVSQNDFSLTNRVNPLSLLKLFLIKFSSKNISVSKSIATSIHTPSEVIYNCYDDDVFTITNTEERTLNFAFIGRLVTQKGCDTLIKACAELKQPFTLTIIGNGPELISLKNLTDKLQLNDQITFTGTKNSAEIVEILNQHQVLIIPSNGKEGFGIVALEGLACGCRIIAANAGGLAEAVGSFGKLFEPGNVEQLSLLLKEELNGTNQATYRPEELDAYLSNYKKEVIAQKYLSIFGSAA